MEFVKSYAQNKEDLIILDYFKGEKGTLLSVGENDGKTFSNAKLLIDNGFKAYLVEPSSVFSKLEQLYKDNKKVKCYNFGLSFQTREVKFYESEEHVKGGSDKALVSTIHEHELRRWKNVKFNEKTIKLVSTEEFLQDKGKIDFISIDCEGEDWNILKEIDLTYYGVKCLIIEWNGDKKLKELYTEYCNHHGLKQIHQNAENLIFAK